MALTDQLVNLLIPGASLLDVISSAMNITPSVMTKAETLYGACTDMLRAVEEISAYTNNVQGHKVIFLPVF